MSDTKQHEPTGENMLLKTLIAHLVMFVIFYGTGLWAIKDL
ncbi:MAG: hypothetical protein ACON4V_07395 [Parvibaculales bacterium]